MNFCSNCGIAVQLRIPPGDNLPRYVCDGCNTIHYQNPKVVAGCLPQWEDKVLLCRRAIEPRYGLWTLPAGFMEIGETTVQTAIRETLEEAGAKVEIADLYTLFNLPYIDQVYLLYRSQLLDLDFAPGDESLEVRLFGETEIPWEQLAFRVMHETLKLYFKDCAAGKFGTYVGDIVRNQDETSYTVSLMNKED